MARDVDLMGLGTAAKLAALEGYGAVAAVTAAGTTTADATVIKKAQDFVSMTATGSDGVRLPADAALMKPYIIYNSSGSTGLIYPPTLGTLNGGTATTGTLSLTTLKVAMFMRYSNTGWIFILTA